MRESDWAGMAAVFISIFLSLAYIIFAPADNYCDDQEIQNGDRFIFGYILFVAFLIGIGLSLLTYFRF